MKLATAGVIKPCNFELPNRMNISSSGRYCATRSCSSSYGLTGLKITCSWNPKGDMSISGESFVARADNKLRDKWMEFQGIKNWEGLLDPLDDGLRDEILRYGEFVEAAYRSFDFDTSSPEYAMCRHPKAAMLSGTGYRVTRNLHATCGVRLPAWAEFAPSWVSTQSSWIGYVAVCTDQDEIARLGRRDVVIAYRGTATCMEWVENLRAGLASLPADMQQAGSGPRESMVQSGFLSLYTSSRAPQQPSLRDTIRDEINKILEKYSDEPLSITVTGHSLGAALATITAHDINSTFKNAPLVTVVSFGGPRIGNKSFRGQLEKSGTKVLRIVNSDDPITKVPGFVLDEESGSGSGGNSKQPPSVRNGDGKLVAGMMNWVQKRVEETQWVYAEIGKELRLSSRDCPHLSDGGVATCHDLKTYLHLVDNFVSTNCPLRATAKRVLSL